LEVLLRETFGWLIVFVLVFAESAPVLNASTRQFQKAVVVRAQKYEPDSPRYGKRTDAPPPATEHDYDISIRLNCSVYVGRYKSAFEHLPGVFAPDQSIEVSLEKHLIYVRVPGAGEIKMGIVRRYGVSGDSCSSGR
jgi:hypothetical protein